MKSSLFEQYLEQGYLIFNNAIRLSKLEKLEIDISKIFSEVVGYQVSVADTPMIMSEIEKEDKEIFYASCKKCGDLASFQELSFNSELDDFMDQLSSHINKPLSSTHAGCFFNKKGVNRLQYNWHQESSYFNKHDLGFHLWFPLFNNISTTGGPMLIKSRSHKRSYNIEVIAKEGCLTQMSVADRDIDDLETIRCELNRTDIVIFDHAIVHRTDECTNETIPRLSGIKRYVGSSSQYLSCSTAINHF